MSNILQDFSPSAISQALDAIEVAFWTLFKNHPAMQLHDEPEIFWFESGTRHNVFNRILQVRFEGNTPPPAIERIVASFQSRRIPFLWHLGPSSRPAHLDMLSASRAIHWGAPSFSLVSSPSDADYRDWRDHNAHP